MSKTPVVVSGTVDLNEAEIGNIICATSATTLNISTAENAEAVIGDTFELMRDTTGAVSVTADEGITLKSKGDGLTITDQYGGVTVTKIGVSTWWLRGALCVALITGIVTFTYNYNTDHNGAMILINWIK